MGCGCSSHFWSVIPENWINRSFWKNTGIHDVTFTTFIISSIKVVHITKETLQRQWREDAHVYHHCILVLFGITDFFFLFCRFSNYHISKNGIFLNKAWLTTLHIFLSSFYSHFVTFERTSALKLLLHTFTKINHPSPSFFFLFFLICPVFFLICHVNRHTSYNSGLLKYFLIGYFSTTKCPPV